jgi:hypothetical protein
VETNATNGTAVESNTGSAATGAGAETVQQTGESGNGAVTATETATSGDSVGSVGGGSGVETNATNGTAVESNTGSAATGAGAETVQQTGESGNGAGTENETVQGTDLTGQVTVSESTQAAPPAPITTPPVTPTTGGGPTIGGTLPLIAHSAGSGQAGGTSGAGVSGAGTTHVLANTGSGPLAAEGFLGAILAMIGVALLKPREILRRFFN